MKCQYKNSKLFFLSLFPFEVFTEHLTCCKLLAEIGNKVHSELLAPKTILKSFFVGGFAVLDSLSYVVRPIIFIFHRLHSTK